MNILFYSPSFYPKIGGLETVAETLAKGLSDCGHQVSLITHTPLINNLEIVHKYTILRNPSITEIWKEYLKCELFIHHNVSLKGLWPLLLYPKKWIVIHHLTYYNRDGKLKTLESLKRGLSRFAHNISCSQFVNQTLPKPGEVIGNPYNDEVFADKHLIRKKNSFLFVGRLVSDKGCDLLIGAFAKVLAQIKDVTLTIVGDGPDHQQLLDMVNSYQTTHAITFKGMLKGAALAYEMNLHQIMVIPSRWKEPFGIVALEGIACGCVPIYSNAGGLAEACVKIGLAFIPNDLEDLAEKMQNGIKNYKKHELLLQESAKAHLEKHVQQQVINIYHNYLVNV